MEHPISVTLTAEEDAEVLARRVVALQGQIGTLETFIRRRFDEISMEINATSQQIDMSEEGMAKRFGEILGVMNAISYTGTGDTPANTGVELEAVIAETSKAATQILDSADRMSALLSDRTDEEWATPEKRSEMLDSLREDVMNVILSCSFQDITSQRIRKTLDSLGDLEERIASTLETMGINVEDQKKTKTDEQIIKGNNQDDIDALFG